MADDGAYGGLVGAFPYAFRRSDSRIFKSYVVVGGLFALLLVVAFGMAVVVAVSNTIGAVGGTFTFSRTFVFFVGFLVVVPLLTPVLLVARRHRREGSTRRYDRALAISGYLFIPALYVLLLISAPPGLRQEPAGLFTPVISFLYDLPPLAGALPPLIAVGVTYLVHRYYRQRED